MAARKTRPGGGRIQYPKPTGPVKTTVRRKNRTRRDVTETMGFNPNTRRMLKKMGYTAD
jgi:hypothetical protein